MLYLEICMYMSMAFMKSLCVCVQLLAIVSKSTKLQTCTVDISGITAKGHLNLKKKKR